MEYTLKSINIKSEKEPEEDVEVTVKTIQECGEHIKKMITEDFEINDDKNAVALAALSKKYKTFLAYYRQGCFSIDIEKFKTLDAQGLLKEIPKANEVCEKRFGPAKIDNGKQK